MRILYKHVHSLSEKPRANVTKLTRNLKYYFCKICLKKYVWDVFSLIFMTSIAWIFGPTIDNLGCHRFIERICFCVRILCYKYLNVNYSVQHMEFKKKRMLFVFRITSLCSLVLLSTLIRFYLLFGRPCKFLNVSHRYVFKYTEFCLYFLFNTLQILLYEFVV